MPERVWKTPFASEDAHSWSKRELLFVVEPDYRMVTVPI
jgi:hypothetical protein